MNPFGSVGLGQALSRGLRRRTEETRALLAREMTASIENDYRLWQEAIGTHPADTAADQIIVRLRTRTGADRAVATTRPPIETAMLGD
jgi:hypothetical protein